MTIREFFNRLNKDTMHLVDEFYDENACFEDPMVSFNSRRQIKDYYVNLYKSVESIEFRFSDEVVSGGTHAALWTMVLKAKLNSGKPIHVHGVSYIQFGGKEGKAVYHRDYFDMGEFVYEKIPVLSSIIHFVKRKLSQPHNTK